jgi:hypothetical protein
MIQQQQVIVPKARNQPIGQLRVVVAALGKVGIQISTKQSPPVFVISLVIGTSD